MRIHLYGTVIELRFELDWPMPVENSSSKRPADVTIELVGQPPARPGMAQPARAGDPDPEVDGWTLSRFGDDRVVIVGFPEDADYYVWEDRIVCHLLDPAARFIVETQLLGTVLAVWLERRGTVTLHASSALVGQQAVAFTAVPGGGKTTAATALVCAGHRLVADDLLAVESSGRHVRVHRGYPMLRLWPDQVERFVGDPSRFPPVHPSYEKRRIDLDAVGFGFAPSTAAIAEVLVPAPDDLERVAFEPLPSSQALLTLWQAGFLGRATRAVTRPRSRLTALAQIIDRVPVTRIRFPRGLDRTDEFVMAVTQRFTALDPR